MSLLTRFYRPLEKMENWHRKFGVKKFIEADEEEQQRIKYIRAKLILEEALEVIEELGFDVEIEGFDVSVNAEFYPHNRHTSLEGLAKELADLKVVTYGTDEVFDIPAYGVFDEVMRSNFSKLGDDGKPVYREDGKVLKGPNYKPADVHGALTGEWL